MKKIINTIFAAALLAVSAISCQKAEDSPTTNNSPEVSREGTISVSLTATMDELTPAEGVKSEITPVIRLTWASEGDVVFVYDASRCLGRLDVTLKNNDARYAYLSGTIETPSDGTEVLTCIHAKGLTVAPSVEDGKVTISLAEQIGQDSEIPFVVFGTIDYDGQSSITDRLVNFSFATSVVNVNCIDLVMDGQNQEQIDKVYIKGLNTSCQLSLSGTAAPEVSGSAIGGIIRKGIAGGSNKLAFLMSVPASQSASERRLCVIQQTRTSSSFFTTSAFAAGKFINVMYKLEWPRSRLESFSLEIYQNDILSGEEFMINQVVLPQGDALDWVIWSSSNEDVATVDIDGKVKGIAKGTATITATTVDGGKTATCSVTVYSSLEEYKSDAIDYIKSAATDAKSEINGKDVPEAVKVNAIQEIEKAVASAETDIENASGIYNVKRAKDLAIKIIQKELADVAAECQSQLVEAKAIAITKVNNDAAKAKSEIDKLNISDAVKEEAKANIDSVVAKATNDINNSTSQEDILSILSNAVAAIEIEAHKVDPTF